MSPSHPDFGKEPPTLDYPSGAGDVPWAYVQEQIDLRRAGKISQEDGMTAMLAAKHPDEDRPYTDSEIVESVNTMLSAGNDTTAGPDGQPVVATRAAP
jgi:cytochrome P450